jgi:hypothetical protein
MDRWDVTANKMWTYSSSEIGLTTYLIRTPEGVTAACNHRTAVSLAEDNTWKTSTLGTRLPASYFENGNGGDYIGAPLNITLESEWATNWENLVLWPWATAIGWSELLDQEWGGDAEVVTMAMLDLSIPN